MERFEEADIAGFRVSLPGVAQVEVVADWNDASDIPAGTFEMTRARKAAQLVEAAPDMFAALLEVQEAFTLANRRRMPVAFSSTDSDDLTMSTMGPKIDAAIKKATGA